MIKRFRITAVALAAAVVFTLAGCLEQDNGPQDIHWDRDACALCGMMISDAAYVSEIRGGPKNELQKFDDIGCAMNWLNMQPWAEDPKTRIWVAEVSSSREHLTWLDARTARYIPARMTPMNYGFGAVETAVEGSIPFEQMVAAVLSNGPNNICKIR